MNISKLDPNLRDEESFRPEVSFYTSESEGEECVCFPILYNGALHDSCLLVFIFKYVSLGYLHISKMVHTLLFLIRKSLS